MSALFNSKFLLIVLFVGIKSPILFCQKVDTCICEKTIPDDTEKYLESINEEVITRLPCGEMPKKSHFVTKWRLVGCIGFPPIIKYPCDCKAKEKFEADKDRFSKYITKPAVYYEYKTLDCNGLSTIHRILVKGEFTKCIVYYPPELK